MKTWASAADAPLPEVLTAVAVPNNTCGSIECHDKANNADDAGARGGGEGDEHGKGEGGGGGGDEEHGGGDTDGEACTAATFAAVAVPLAPPPHAPAGAPLQPRFALAPLALAIDASEFTHLDSLVAAQAPHDSERAALQTAVVL